MDTLNNTPLGTHSQQFVKENPELSALAKYDTSQLSVDTLKTKAVKMAKREAEEAVKNTSEYKALSGIDKRTDLYQLENYKDHIAQTAQELKQAKAQQELKQKMTATAKDYINQNADKIQQLQSQMTNLKKIYSSVSNSKDLSPSKKRSSLKGSPIGKRLFVGGHFNITKKRPFTMDLSPNYRLPNQ